MYVRVCAHACAHERLHASACPPAGLGGHAALSLGRSFPSQSLPHVTSAQLPHTKGPTRPSAAWCMRAHLRGNIDLGLEGHLLRQPVGQLVAPAEGGQTTEESVLRLTLSI